jgi:uncharacterized protein with FMN-binding domain
MSAVKSTLIVVGTAGGLGAVLAYSPPHHSLNLGGMGGGTSGGISVPTATPSTAQTPATSATPAPAETSAAPTPTTSTTSSAPTTTTPTPAKKSSKPSAPKQKLVNGIFDGATSSTVYGPVQVQITVKNSKIVAAKALQLPTGTSVDDQIDAQAVPLLISETIAAQSANISGVSGASYTSQGWYDSLVSAVNKAGL